MYCITVESNRPSPRKQRHTDPVIHSRLLTHDRSPCLRPFLHRTLNHTSQAASTHTTDAGFQLWRQNSSQPELVVKPVSQPVRRNQIDPLPGYSCAVSHAAVQVTGPPVQPAGQPDTYSPIGIMLNVRSLLHGGVSGETVCFVDFTQTLNMLSSMYLLQSVHQLVCMCDFWCVSP